MKVLWLSNVILPQVSVAVGKSVSAFGGWLIGMAKSLSSNPDVEFHVSFSAPKGERYEGEVKGIRYHSFTQFSEKDCNKQNEAEFAAILGEVNPDVIHIFGTEYAHTLAMVNACQTVGLGDKVVISIQGLVSTYYYYYYYAYLPWKIVNRWTFRDILRMDNIRLSAKGFLDRGKSEIAALEKVKHVIGRTDWDEACVKRINPDVQYHFCNESLRDTFYENTWGLEHCEKHSLFVSQCSYPIKGFHLMLEAMEDIVKRYPDAHLYTTGKSPLCMDLRGKLRQNSYSKYLAELLHRYHLEDKVTFLGTLDEQAMAERFLKSHVFVSPSSIENSPNSVGEAMILGVPTVASDVGGVKNMLTHGKEGFVYPADEPYMIAHYVSKIFDDDELAQHFSAASREHAAQTHDREKNMETLLCIYEQVSKTA